MSWWDKMIEVEEVEEEEEETECGAHMKNKSGKNRKAKTPSRSPSVTHALCESETVRCCGFSRRASIFIHCSPCADLELINSAFPFYFRCVCVRKAMCALARARVHSKRCDLCAINWCRWPDDKTRARHAHYFFLALRQSFQVDLDAAATCELRIHSIRSIVWKFSSNHFGARWILFLFFRFFLFLLRSVCFLLRFTKRKYRNCFAHTAYGTLVHYNAADRSGQNKLPNAHAKAEDESIAHQ